MHRGKADRFVVARVLLSTLFKKWMWCCPFSSHQRPLLTTSSQISWRVAWQLYQPIPSGCISSGPTDLCSGSSNGQESDLLLQWEGLYSPSSCLVVHLLEKCGHSLLGETEAKQLCFMSLFSLSVKSFTGVACWQNTAQNQNYLVL